MGVLDFLFSIFKRNTNTSDRALIHNNTNKNKRGKGRKGKRRGSALLAFLLVGLVLTAQPAAAFSFGSITEKVSGFVDTVKNNVLGGAVGAIGGAKAGATIGAMVGGPVGAVVGAVIGGVAGYILGAYAEKEVKDSIGLGDSDESVNINLQTAKNVTVQEFEDNTPMLNSLVQNITSETDQAAAQDLQILLSKLQSTLVDYDYTESGSSGEFMNVHLQGPASMYGFSAFPFKFQLTVRGNTEVPDPVYLTSVKIYVKDTATGNIYWTREWSYELGEMGGEEGTVLAWETILKGPDDLASSIDTLLNGQADEALIEEIFSKAPQEYEIIVEVTGYREIYVWDGSQWVHDHDEQISATYETLSGYKHIGAGIYAVSGFSGSLPISFKDSIYASQFTAFQMRVAGSSSNLVARLWSVPLQVLNATVQYKVYVQGNPDYFYPLQPAIIDDARIVVYRILKDGSWELAAAAPLEGPATLGDLAEGKLLTASITYHADDATVSYRAFVIIKALVSRDDGAQMPVWIVMEPAIAPISPEQTVSIDPYVQEIGDLAEDNTITQAEALRLQAIADSLINSLNAKIQTAAAWKEKGEAAGKEDVVKYANLAIEHYNEAIKYAEKLKETSDAQDVLRFAEIVKEEEVIGDYYVRAAELAYYGQEEQALSLISNAESLEQNVNEYKSALYSVLLPLDDKQAVLIFALKVVVSLAGIYVARKLFGDLGALIVGALVGIYWLGPLVGISL